MLSLRYSAPAPDLRQLVSSYYLFRADLPRVSDIMRADTPQLRFMVSGSGFYTFGDGRTADCPEIMLTGPTMSATGFTAVGPLWVFGIGILPMGWSALVCESADTMADRVVDARGMFGPLLDDVLDALRGAGSIETMASIANVAVRALARNAHEPLAWFTRATDEWLTGNPSPEIDDLVAVTGLSHRQVERLAKRIYGGPPKLLARKYRALRAASLLARNAGDWQDVAGDSFYDQSHFIREFKRFTGLTPKRFQLDPPPVMRLTLARRSLEGQLPPLVLVS